MTPEARPFESRDGGYCNSTKDCEGMYCTETVFADYIPFCKTCFKSCMSEHGGIFKSRDGLWYRYTGKSWVLDKGLNRRAD